MRVVVVPLLLLTAACSSAGLPTTPSATAFPAEPSGNSSPVTVIPPAPGSVLSIAMPIDGADIVTNAFALLPFGYHGADHAGAGHSGWDIEYRVGAQVRAAADGVVQAIEPDIIVLGRSRVTVEHALGAHIYRTVYANLSSIREEIVLDGAVTRGQPIGVAGTVTSTIGATPVTYAMTHFQVDDFETHREGLDPKAVSPEPFLSADGRAIFDRIWPRSVFAQELTEPFMLDVARSALSDHADVAARKRRRPGRPVVHAHDRRWRRASVPGVDAVGDRDRIRRGDLTRGRAAVSHHRPRHANRSPPRPLRHRRRPDAAGAWQSWRATPDPFSAPPALYPTTRASP